MLRIHLLGGLALCWDDEPLPLIQTTLARSIFAYLVLNRQRSHSRTVLAGLFWPDAPEKQARRNLRQALWHIARVVNDLPCGPYLLREGDTVAFNTALPHWVDVDEFESLSQGDVTAMAKAMLLYRGPLLPEIFDDWVLVDRERLHERWLALLERLALSYQEQGQSQAAVETLRTLLSSDPWHEPAACLLMRLLADMGRVGESIQVYVDLCNRLQADLGVSPSPETIALYREIRSIRPSTFAVPPPPIQPSQPRLVGRQAELAIIEATTQAARTGRGQFLLLTGPPGIGKTRLALAAAKRAHHLGFWVLYASALEPLGPPAPYTPLEQALRKAVKDLGNTPPGISPLTQAVLSALLPDLIPSPVGMNLTELEPWHFHSSLAAIIASLTEISPLFLVLDNLHWADPAIWPVMQALIPRLPELPLLLLVCFRPYELPEEMQDLTRLNPTPPLYRLDLQPLSLEEVKALTTEIAGGVLPLTFINRLHQETGGNPLFILEVMRGLTEEGFLCQSPSGEWTFPPGEAIPIPATIKQAIAGRLKQLLRPSYRLLQQAAVLGDSFDFDLLWAMSGKLDEEQLFERIDELLARGLLVEQEGCYHFAHDLVRRVLYEKTHPRLRRTWHRRAAQVLAQMAPQLVAARARHAYAAHEWPEALTLALEAAEQALGLFTLTEALKFYQMAREAEEHLGGEASPERLRRLQGEARIYRLHGDLLAEAELLREWRATAQALDNSCAETLAMSALADNLRRRGRSADALPIAQEAVSIAVEQNAPGILAAALLSLGSCHESLGDLTMALKFYKEAVIAASHAHNARQEADCLNSLGIALQNDGQLTRAAEVYQQAAELAKACGDRFTESRALNNLATLYTLWGDLGPARRAYEGVLATVEALDIREGIALVQRNLAEVWLLMGHLDKSRFYLEAALELMRKMEYPANHAKVMLDLVGWAIAADRPKEALNFLDEAKRILPQQELREEHLYYHYQAVGVYLALGDASTAAEHLACLAEMAAEAGFNWLEGEIAFLRGRVNAAQGSLEIAERSLRKAVEVWKAQGLRASLANARAELGLVLHRLGCYAESSELLAIAWEEMARRMLRMDLARLLRRLGHPPTLPGQREVKLPLADAPLRRCPTPEECCYVLWTPDAGPLEPILPRKPLRRARIRRLLTEAAVQGAVPTVNHLARALRVSPATLYNDLATLRREGWPVITRGSQRLSV